MKRLKILSLVFLLITVGGGGYLFGYRQGRTFQQTVVLVAEAGNAYFELDRIAQLGGLEPTPSVLCYFQRRLATLIPRLDQCLKNAACSKYIAKEIGLDKYSAIQEKAKKLEANSSTCTQ